MNDLEVIKHDLLFSNNYKKEFALSEVPYINYYQDYLKELKAKLLDQKINPISLDIYEY